MPPSFGQPEAVPATTGPTLALLGMWAVEAEPRLGGPLMKALAAAAPLTGLQHLKRVRKQGGRLQVLLCRVDWRQQNGDDDQQQDGGQAAIAAQQQEEQRQANGAAAGEAGSPSCAANGGSSSSGGQTPDLPPAVAEIVKQHGLQPCIAQVPLHAAITREQFVEWGKHWPMTWRGPDASALPHLIELSSAEVASMQRHMAAAWQLAAANGAAGGIANACLIVDPQRDAVIAQAADCSHAHPLQHAAMAAVAAASEWQLRVWPPEQAELAGSASKSAAAAAAPAPAPAPAAAPVHAGLVHAASGQLDAADGKRRRLEGSADVQAAAGTAAAAATNGQEGEASGIGAQAAAAAAQQGLPSPVSGAAADGPAAPDAAPAAAASAAAAEGDPGPRPYLCTGYDAYLLHEPCVMCAMALVHSRLRRVIYCVPDAQHGALGGALKLHSQRSLNHHYTVWRLPLAGGRE